MRISVLVILLCIICFGASAQTFTISGTIIDRGDSAAMTGVTVILRDIKDTSNISVLFTDIKGYFSFDNVKPDKYSLNTFFVGYKTLARVITISKASVNLGTLKMQKSSYTLEDVVIKASPVPVEIHGDTTQYAADAFKTHPDATAEDLVTKMPGLTSANGVVTSNGEQVQNVYVDGKPYFGDDPTLALKNLPAEVIDKVQVFSQLSDQAQFTGFDDGNSTKAINIITKKGKSNGEFGKFFAGYGDDDRYLAGGGMNFFDGARRFSIIGLFNNVNQQNFATQDILGALGGGSGGRGAGSGGGAFRGGGGGGFGGGGAGGGGLGGGANVNNFLVGQQGGISTTNSVGFNYSDQWGSKIKITASYFYNTSQNVTVTSLTRKYITPSDTGLLYNENDNSQTNNYNNRFNLRLEYTIDSSNSIIITPKVNFQTTRQSESTIGYNYYPNLHDTVSSVNEYTTSNTNGYNFGGNFLFRHKFHKKGRTISFNVAPSANTNDGVSTLNSTQGTGDSSLVLNQKGIQNTKALGVNSNVAYTEPLSKTSQLLFSYNNSYTNNNTMRDVYNFSAPINEYNVLDTTLSNQYNDVYITNKGSVNYRFSKNNKLNLMAGVAFQYATLTGAEVFPYAYNVSRTFQDILPIAMMNYKFSKEMNLRVMYRSYTDVPSITQLQNVINNTNPLELSTGNPALKEDQVQSLMARFGFTSTKKFNTILFYMLLNHTQNYIGNSTFLANRDTLIIPGVLLDKGGQITKPVNLNGYWNSQEYATFGLPIKFIKCNLNLTSGVNYTRAPGLVDDATNIANTTNLTQSVGVSSNISQNIDFNVSYTANYDLVTNSLEEQANDNYYYHTVSAKLNYIFLKAFVFNTSVSETYYNGLGEGYNTDYWLWNGSLGYKFLKNQAMQVSVSCFDILKQNKSISRTVTDTYIQDTQTNVLQQYFMLNVQYNIRKFKA